MTIEEWWAATKIPEDMRTLYKDTPDGVWEPESE